MHKSLIAASVMCVSMWHRPEETLRKLEEEKIDLLHADVMDGIFVDNLMLGTDAVKALRRESTIPLDIHLMIESPEKKIAWFEPQPGEWVSVHAESTKHLCRALVLIREYGAHPMAALNPATPLCMLEEAIDMADGILLMTVNPGFAGQKLVPQTIGKISRLRQMLDDRGRQDIRIEVDGNVSFENAVKMRQAGADIFVCGTSSIFGKTGTPEENIARFRACVGD